MYVCTGYTTAMYHIGPTVAQPRSDQVLGYMGLFIIGIYNNYTSYVFRMLTDVGSNMAAHYEYHQNEATKMHYGQIGMTDI